MSDYIARALAKNVQLSPQKGRLVADLIRGKAVGDAVERLQFVRQKGGAMVAKVLNSALANAEDKAGADVDELMVSRIEVSDGMHLSRVRFGARGRVNRITRRRSHILVELRRKGKSNGSES